MHLPDLYVLDLIYLTSFTRPILAWSFPIYVTIYLLPNATFPASIFLFHWMGSMSMQIPYGAMVPLWAPCGHAGIVIGPLNCTSKARLYWNESAFGAEVRLCLGKLNCFWGGNESAFGTEVRLHLGQKENCVWGRGEIAFGRKWVCVWGEVRLCLGPNWDCI